MSDFSTDNNVLPQPFGPAIWPKAQRQAATALWNWHLELAQSAQENATLEERVAFFEAEGARAEAGQPLQLLPPSLTEATYSVCQAHQLPLALLASQVRAAKYFVAPIRFETYATLHAFLLQWVGSHARLLAHLAGHKGSWQVHPVEELARAFFLTGRLVTLTDDLEKDWLFIPLDELQEAGVTLEHLRTGSIDEAMQRLFWKQMVRIRDAYAQGQALIKDLSGKQARLFKEGWLGGLEVLNTIERARYDVWTRPITLSLIQRLRVRIQAIAGKTSFR